MLAERVPAWILWPFALLIVVAAYREAGVIAEADLFLDFLFVLAAILVVYWLFDRERWRLVTATVLMGGMVMTKREGLLLAAVLLVAALIASARDWRFTHRASAWSGGSWLAVAAPWRIWYLARGVEGEGSGRSARPDAERGSPLA